MNGDEDGALRVVPRRRAHQHTHQHAQRHGDPAPGTLAKALLAVTTAGLLDPGRFRRGREYAATGAVSELIITRGDLRGQVQGSRRTPYVVHVGTELAARPTDRTTLTSQQLASLCPGPNEMEARCTCPDADEGICKHAAAVLLVFADEVEERPELLAAWRCGDGAPPARATLGSRRRSAGAPTPAPPPPSPFATPAWQEFFSAPSPLPDAPVVGPASASDALGTERLGELDLSEMVRSARAALCRSASD